MLLSLGCQLIFILKPQSSKSWQLNKIVIEFLNQITSSLLSSCWGENVPKEYVAIIDEIYYENK